VTMVGKRGEYLFKKLKKINFFTFAIILIVWCGCVKCENGKILEIAQQCEQRCPDQVSDSKLFEKRLF
jgi:hypothetical protein